MRKATCSGILVLLLVMSFSTSTLAQDPVRYETQYGVGFQGTFPSAGISGMMDVSEEISVQGIIGFASYLTTITGRGLYRFSAEEWWDAYGYGMLGLWSYRGGTDTESSLAFGIGAGLSYDWRGFAEDLPPVRWNIEIGIGSVQFEAINYSAIMIGAGAHYRF